MSITVKSRRTTTFDVVTDLELLEQWRELVAAEKEASREEARSSERLGVRAGAAEKKSVLTEEIARVEAELTRSTFVFAAKALASSEFQLLLARHRPKAEATPEDKAAGYDRAGLCAELLPKSITGVETFDGEPVPFDPATEWAELAESMSYRQREDVHDKILRLNLTSAGTDFPRSRAISKTPRG